MYKSLEAMGPHRCQVPSSRSFVFSDASEKVIAAVAYLKTVDSDGSCHMGFITGKARLAPQPEHTIPRLELCAAVLAVNMMEPSLQRLLSNSMRSPSTQIVEWSLAISTMRNADFMSM